MRPALGLALLGLLLASSGCAHTKTTDAGEVSEPPKGSAPPTDHPPPSAGQQPSGIPVASTPEGLLAPGGEQQIRDKLIEGGYLKKGGETPSLEAALRQAQKDHDLPATGVPDHRTVKALGLDPNRIFKHAE